MTLRNIDENFRENFSDLVKVRNDVNYFDDDKGIIIGDRHSIIYTAPTIHYGMLFIFLRFYSPIKS